MNKHNVYMLSLLSFVKFMLYKDVKVVIVVMKNQSQNESLFIFNITSCDGYCVNKVGIRSIAFFAFKNELYVSKWSMKVKVKELERIMLSIIGKQKKDWGITVCFDNTINDDGCKRGIKRIVIFFVNDDECSVCCLCVMFCLINSERCLT